MGFDVASARAAGASDDDILQHLTSSRSFDVDGARKAGASTQDIISYLANTAPKKSLTADADRELARQGLTAKAPGSVPPYTPDVGPLARSVKAAKETLSSMPGAIASTALEVNKFLHPANAAMTGQIPDPVKLGEPNLQMAQKAKEQYGQGNLVGAAAYGAAAATPWGPMVADVGEMARSGDLAGAATKTAIMAAPLVATKAAPLLKQPLAVAADRMGIPAALRESAQTQYNRVLGATTKPNKIKSQQAVAGYSAPAPEVGEAATAKVPGLIERGVTAFTRKGLLKKISGTVDNLTGALEDQWENLPGERTTPADRVYRSIDDSLRGEFTRETPRGTAEATGPDAQRGMNFGQDLKSYLKQHEVIGPDGKPSIRYDTLRKFRQDWDGLVESVKGFQGDLTNNVNKAAYKAASNGIREIVNGDNPSIAALNREISFWLKAKGVLEDTVTRTTGQAKPLGRKLARVGGQVAGFGAGGVKGAVLAGEAMDAAEAAMSSPGWRTMTSVAKQRIADAITREAQKAFVPAGLLTEGSIKPPPPVDTSGPIADRDWLQHRVMVEPKLLPPSTAPYGTSGVMVPDVLGRPGRTSGYMIEGPQQPTVPTSGKTFYVGSPGMSAEQVRGSMPDANIPLGRGGAGRAAMQRGGGVRPESSQAAGQHGGFGVQVSDTSGDYSVTGNRSIVEPYPSVIPPEFTGRVIESNTQPAPRGRMADADWWSQQPLTKTELQHRYEQLFNRAENLSPQRPVSVPESGIPEGVARGIDARENIARQVLHGRTWEQATPTERNVIDQLIAEGLGTSVPPPVSIPASRRTIDIPPPYQPR